MTDASPIVYREYLPAPQLLHLVRCYWTVHGSALGVGPLNRVLPDGCMDLIFSLGTAPTRTDGAAARSGAYVVGPMLSAQLFRHAGLVDFIGVRFRPGVAPFLLRVPAHDLIDTTVAAADIWPDAALLLPRLADAPSDRARAAQLDAFLLHRLGECVDRQPGVIAAAAAIERARGQLRIDQLADGMGWNVRALQRAFLERIGMSPKQTARVARFQHAVALLSSSAPALVRIAYTAGYYDQAHFTREFRQLAGLTPAAWLAERGVAIVQDDPGMPA